MARPHIHRIIMVDAQYFEVIPSRKVDNANFPLGVQEYSFSVGAPNVWHPCKSYFRIGMTLYGAPGPNFVVDQPYAREMVAFADNAVGNMFDNAYVRSNNVEISSISQGLAQASALNARIGQGYAWLKSLGSGASLQIFRTCDVHRAWNTCRCLSWRLKRNVSTSYPRHV